MNLEEKLRRTLSKNKINLESIINDKPKKQERFNFKYFIVFSLVITFLVVGVLIFN